MTQRSFHRDNRFHSRRMLMLSIPFVAVALAWWFLRAAPTESFEDQFAKAAKAVEEKRLDDAYEIISRLSTESSDPEVLTMLAVVEDMRGDPDRALDVILQMPGYQTDPTLAAYAVQFALKAPRLSVAETLLETAVASQPGNSEAIRMLSNLKANLIKTQEVRKLIAQLDRNAEATAEDILIYCSGNRVSYDVFENVQRLRSALDNEPHEGSVVYALCINYIRMNRISAAEQLLADSVDKEGWNDQWLIDLAALELAVVNNNYDSAAQSLVELGPNAIHRSEFWICAARTLRERGQTEAALSAFRNAATLAPFDPEPVFAAAHLLKAKDPESAKTLQDRFELLAELDVLVKSVIALETLDEAVERIPAIVGLLIDLEAFREARTCLAWLEKEGYRSFEATKQKERFKSLVAVPPVSLKVPSVRQLEELPIDRLLSSKESSRSTNSSLVPIALQDSSLIQQLNFEYRIPERLDQTLLSSLGAGVCCFDADNDLRPDLFLPQASDPDQPSSLSAIGALFRIRDQTVLPCESWGVDSRSAAISIHGVQQADINNDGFTDLVLTGFGINLLMVNNGDGTFTECGAEWNLQAAEWSTSAAFADFDQNGTEDLYVANYLDVSLSEIAARKGQPFEEWGPIHVESRRDRVYTNTGTGFFQETTEQSLPRVVIGKGLGVATADFDLDGQVDVFVSNDTTANFLLSNISGNTIQFEETGVQSGVAFGTSGQAEASMGIAPGDVDQDGLTDLFVTNFQGQTNTLYMNLGNRRFTDRTESMNLARTSYPLMGWGTALQDLDFDGLPELVTLNGHLNESSMMPTLETYTDQGFSSRSVNGTQYFETASEGRSLAIADMNEDLVPDLVITHRKGPPTILEVSGPQQPVFQIYLTGTQSARTANHTRVTMSATDQKPQTGTLNSSGNYLSSSQRVLSFRKPASENVNLKITWPSGTIQQLKNVSLSKRLMIVESAAEETEGNIDSSRLALPLPW